MAGDQPQLAGQIIDQAQHAYVGTWAGTMWVGVGILVVAVLYVAVAGPSREAIEETTLEDELVAAR